MLMRKSLATLWKEVYKGSALVISFMHNQNANDSESEHGPELYDCRT